MTEQDRQGLHPQKGLTPEEYTAIEQLAAVCNQHDNITLKLNYDNLRTRPNEETNDFLHYENGTLVGYLGLYQFNNHEIEISGMVHPANRRQGIFTGLLSAAKEEIRRRGIAKLIFMNQKGSAAGQAFLQALGAQYSFSEHWMKLTRTQLQPLRDPIQVRQMLQEDLPSAAHIFAACFGQNESDVLESLIMRQKTNNKRHRMIIELAGTTIGTITTTYDEPNNAFISGFCVHPEHQGRGYGRQALALTIQKALADQRSTIELEVACENINALSLYQSCGFEAVNANDYYVQMIEV